MAIKPNILHRDFLEIDECSLNLIIPIIGSIESQLIAISMLASRPKHHKSYTPKSHIYVRLINGHQTIVKKTIIRDEQDAKFSINEATLLNICQHPSVIKLIDFYTDKSNHHSLEMEYLAGGNMGNTQINGDYEKVWKWVFQISQGLNHIHSKGIIHRDVKLSNFVLDMDENAKLIDFGVSAFKKGLESQGYRLVGTPCYTAPEMIKGLKYDEKIDVYAFGVCLYQLIFTRLPFSGENVKEYWKNTLTCEVFFEKQCPQELAKLIKVMLEKDPAKRPTAGDVLKSQSIQKRFFRI